MFISKIVNYHEFTKETNMRWLEKKGRNLSLRKLMKKVDLSHFKLSVLTIDCMKGHFTIDCPTPKGIRKQCKWFGAISSLMTMRS